MHVLFSVSALLFLLSGTPSEESGPSWRHSPLWDDGNAEFSVYETRWAHYGRLNPGRTTLVVVKEPWSPRDDVKADQPGPDSFDVIKLNHMRDVRTGIYEYHQVASVFIRRDDGRVRKLAATSSEACGITTCDMTKGRLRTRSYWDRQADRAMPWPAGAVAEDGLPVHLRDFVTGKLPRQITVFPSLMASLLPPLEPTTYMLSRHEVSKAVVPAGTFAAVELRLEINGRVESYVFEKPAPHRLLSMRLSDKTELRLVKSERIRYWMMNDPKGVEWLPGKMR